MRTGFRLHYAVVVLVLLTAVPVAAAAQDQAKPAPTAEDATELAKKLSNPIADLVSVPFQMNWESGVGPNEQTRFILNVQPVMPFTLNKDWNMIARVIMPFVNQPPIAAGLPADFGMSDVLASFFFSPSNSAAFTWGVGPAISLPSTTQPTLGTEKWSAGPTFVILKQQSGWTVGVLANQVWSFAGNKDRADVSQMFLQPFVAYTTKTLWTLTVQSESTANWKADGADRWTIPANVLIAKLSTFGVFPASYQLGGGVFVAGPANGPTWKLRTAMTILLPRRK